MDPQNQDPATAQTAFGTPAAPVDSPEQPEGSGTQLGDNDLARYLTLAWKAIEGKLAAIVGAVLVAGVAVAIVAYLQKASADANAEAWKAYDESNGADGFLEVAADYPQSSAAGPALVQAGRDHLNQGIRRSLSDRTRSVGDLKDAQELFEDALDRNDLPDELTLQAQHGLATALEALSDGSDESIAAAKAAYERLAQMGQQANAPRYVGYANDRLVAMDQPRTKQFYAWLAGQTSTPVERPEPKDGPSSETDDLKSIVNGAETANAEANESEPDKAADDTGIGFDSRSMEEKSVPAGKADELYDIGEDDGTDGVSAAQDDE